MAQALQLTPVQDDVEIDRPTGDEAARCRLVSESSAGSAGWLVRDANGQTLRRFRDSNGDNKVDQWRYYKDGKAWLCKVQKKKKTIVDWPFK